MFDPVHRVCQFVEDKRLLAFTDIWHRFDSLHRSKGFYVSLDCSRRSDRIAGQARISQSVFRQLPHHDLTSNASVTEGRY